jgi:hypothetical protein
MITMLVAYICLGVGFYAGQASMTDLRHACPSLETVFWTIPMTLLFWPLLAYHDLKYGSW